MQPNTQVSGLSSIHNVTTYIHNKFVERLKELKTDILVSNEYAELV
jgi:hypothetical protein